ncbi:Fis family transcriptional regulator [Lasiodiplodia theobromae]|uniref:Fis family transcriptional regulator n=1 Tax=Lasiodiplodia theobromae TaxID=45133 RepID=UPI0015C34F8B|nr:Fis family transcriptional regulator [Lasiodiplodia theobromae]KAF4544255.1 Fis family transcriptional regulator [Lasiodiplodia theobromae]
MSSSTSNPRSVVEAEELGAEIIDMYSGVTHSDTGCCSEAAACDAAAGCGRSEYDGQKKQRLATDHKIGGVE